MLSSLILSVPLVAAVGFGGSHFGGFAATMFQHQHGAPTSVQYHHVYLTGYANGRSGIFRYPLFPDGLPAKTPDSILYGGLSGPQSLGFDGAGYLYVVDAGEVKVYPPHAVGNTQPVRTLTVSTPHWIAVDPAGYVYVTSGYFTTVIDVFAPGAGVSSPPVNVIPEPSNPGNTFWGLAVDGQDRLYAAGFYWYVYRYDHPVTEQTSDRMFFDRSVLAWPITFDAEQNRVYSRVYPDIYNPWEQGEYGYLDLDGSRLQTNPWLTYSRDCPRSGSVGSLDYGVAVDTHYLMFSCNTLGTVLVYRNLPGKRKLIESIGSHFLAGTQGMLMGP